MMLSMNRPLTASKLLLVADQRGGATRGPIAPVRRYRSARLRRESRSSQPSARFEPLKRVFDSARDRSVEAGGLALGPSVWELS